MKSMPYSRPIRSLALLCFAMYGSLVFACPDDQYEQCFLGVCVCLQKCGGDICDSGQVVISESQRFINNLAAEIGKTPSAVQECLGNVSRCANEILTAPLALPVQAYIEGLYRQSERDVIPFSQQFINLAQPYYDIDLRGVTSSDNIDTGHGMHLAYCDRIFFTTTIDLWNSKKDLHTVLHEIEHLVQCQKRGRRTFLTEYLLKGGANIVATGRLNIHDIHEFEVSAEAKANSLTDMLWNKIQSSRGSGTNGGTPNPSNGCSSGEVYMPTAGGACCTPNYSRCRNLTTGVVTCGGFGC